MLGKNYLTGDTNLTKFVDFKPVETKEAKKRDGLSNKIEVEVIIYCINCMPNLIHRDIEEIRMFEYSFSYHNHLLNYARMKTSQKMESAQIVPQFSSAFQPGAQSVPAIISNNYMVPPMSLSQPYQSNFQFPLQQNTQFPSFPVTTQQSQPFTLNLNQQPNTNLPSTSNFNISNFFPKPAETANIINQPPQQQPFQLQWQQFGSTSIAAITTATGLSSVWSTPAITTVAASAALPPPPPIVYPSSHLGAVQPPYNPQPPFYMPQQRFYPYANDPYMYMRPPVIPYSPDPYSYLYRDFDYFDSSKESANLQKLLIQRQAAQALWYRYGIDPSIPLSSSLLAERDRDDRRRNRDTTIDYIPERESKDAVIHVVPTLAGIKDGKQQIILNIEETSENRSYIPKIFNPNSEISFTITSKENSANKSYLASLVNDATDEAIPENLLHQSPSMARYTKDLPKPIINSKLTSKKKSILDMDLSDYQIVPRMDRHVSGSSVDRRRVTFQDEADALLNSISKKETTPSYDTEIPQRASILEVSSIARPSPDRRQTHLYSPTAQKTSDSILDRSKSGKIGGTLASFNDSSYGPTNFQSLNDSQTTVSKFKWTPSWFISKIIGGFSSESAQISDNIETADTIQEVANISGCDNACRVILTREGYYTRPASKELDILTKNDHCFVKNFVVGRYNVGKVVFHGETNIFGINLDKIVFINEYEIEVYRDSDSTCFKPPVGEGLNKPATLTLFNIFPQDSDGQPIRNFDQDSLKDFEEYLHKKSDNLNAKFLEYLPDIGSFSFIVEHFTKYSLALSDVLNVSKQKQSSKSDNTVIWDKKNISQAKENLTYSPTPSRTPTVILPKYYMSFSRRNSSFSRFRNHISRSELFFTGHLCHWSSPFRLYSISHPRNCYREEHDRIFPQEIIIQNQNINLMKLDHTTDRNIDFHQSTNIQVLPNYSRIIN